jgi:hypothetical protein
MGFDVMLLVHHEISDESQSKNFENAFVVCYVILPNQNNCHRHAGELHNALNFVVYKGCCVRHQKVLRAAMFLIVGCSVALLFSSLLVPQRLESFIYVHFRHR